MGPFRAHTGRYRHPDGPVEQGFQARLNLRYTSIGEQIAHREVWVPLDVNLVSADEAPPRRAPTPRSPREVVILRSARAQQQAREHADRGEF